MKVRPDESGLVAGCRKTSITALYKLLMGSLGIRGTNLCCCSTNILVISIPPLASQWTLETRFPFYNQISFQIMDSKGQGPIEKIKHNNKRLAISNQHAKTSQFIRCTRTLPLKTCILLNKLTSNKRRFLRQKIDHFSRHRKIHCTDFDSSLQVSSKHAYKARIIFNRS